PEKLSEHGKPGTGTQTRVRLAVHVPARGEETLNRLSGRHAPGLLLLTKCCCARIPDELCNQECEAVAPPRCSWKPGWSPQGPLMRTVPSLVSRSASAGSGTLWADRCSPSQRSHAREHCAPATEKFLRVKLSD